MDMLRRLISCRIIIIIIIIILLLHSVSPLIGGVSVVVTEKSDKLQMQADNVTSDGMIGETDEC